MRVQDLRSSSALAHEADVVLILNHSFDLVARRHLIYRLANAEPPQLGSLEHREEPQRCGQGGPRAPKALRAGRVRP